MQKLLFVTSSAAVTVYFYYIVEFTTRIVESARSRELYILFERSCNYNCIALKLSLSWEESALSIKRRRWAGQVVRDTPYSHSNRRGSEWECCVKLS
jgi:hypothetical protein